MNKENCALKLVDETMRRYKILNFKNNTRFKMHIKD